MSRKIFAGVLLLGVACCAGCADNALRDPGADAASAGKPITVQMLQVAPELTGHRFSNMLNFESPTDAVFVPTVGALEASIDAGRSHTGQSSLRLRGGAGRLTVKLTSLLGSRPFPGDWTLAGAYFFSESPSTISVRCDVGLTTIAENSVTLEPGQWTAVAVDLANSLRAAMPPPGDAVLSFGINPSGVGTVWCDDVVLVDNTQWIIGGEESHRSGAWSIVRRGLKIICSASDRFAVRLAPADAQRDGWQLEEANALRARFSSTGEDKRLTVYADGRSYWDGEYRPLAADLRNEPLWAMQQLSPADVEINESLGRLNRTSEGDENNDGYNESRASYTIVAHGPRLALTIAPRSSPMLRPMLEITGLPLGETLVTVEGRLVQRTLRLDDGTLLVELPGRLDRLTSVSLRVQ